jgi:TonB-dependent SusC/RagA subfamily outer membrane receptor
MFNKNAFRIFLLILLSALLTCNINAQKNYRKVTISGSVLNAGLYPVGNAIVIVDGQKTKVMTDPEGKYRIRVSPLARKIGIVSFTSGIIEEYIDGRSRINFRFKDREAQIKPEELPEIPIGDEAVNTGYGHTKKKLLANHIKKINGRESKYASYKSIEEMLEREVSGVRVSGGQVVIYNSSNLYGPVPALVMVDGVPTDDIEVIKPPMVESIEVLKDASAAIYGTRAYGGAVLITTRK